MSISICYARYLCSTDIILGDTFTMGNASRVGLVANKNVDMCILSVALAERAVSQHMSWLQPPFGTLASPDTSRRGYFLNSTTLQSFQKL